MPSKYDRNLSDLEINNAEVKMCLSCPKTRCDNCLDKYPARKQSSIKLVDVEEFIDLYNKGIGVYVMASTLGLDPRTIVRRLDTMRAPHRPGRTRIHLTVEHVECLPNYMQRQFTLKGVPMA